MRPHPRAKQAGHLCSQRDQDAAGSTTSLVTVTSITGSHKFKIRWVQRGLSPFVFQQVTAWQPEAEDLSRQATDSPLQCCLHLVQAARGPLLRHLAWGSQLQHPLCHTEPWGCPSPGAALPDPHPMSMPRRHCHVAASTVMQGTLFPLHCWGVVPAHSHPSQENSKLLCDRSNPAPLSAEQLSLRSFKMQEDSEQRAASPFLPDTFPSCLLCSPASQGMWTLSEVKALHLGSATECCVFHWQGFLSLTDLPVKEKKPWPNNCFGYNFCTTPQTPCLG